jgi:hypothetical protein
MLHVVLVVLLVLGIVVCHYEILLNLMKIRSIWLSSQLCCSLKRSRTAVMTYTI